MSACDAWYSVVVPVYNSGDNLHALFADFKRVLTNKDYLAELILVDDASNEATGKIAEILAAENENVTTIRVKKNSGQVAATTCGIHHARGKIIITMDDDLQYPMKEVLKLINHHHQSGKKIIFGYPNSRMHSFRHNVAAKLVIWLYDYVLLPQYRKINFYTTFRIFNRSLFFDNTGNILQRHLFYVWDIPVADMDSIPVEHHPRKAGKSSYTMVKRVRTLLPGIYFALLRLSEIMLVPSVILVLISSMLNDRRTSFFPLSAAFCIFLIASIMISKILIRRAKKIEYQIDKIVK